MDEVQNRIKEMLDKHNNGIWMSKLPHFYKELYKEELNQGIIQQCEHWPHICTVCFSLFLPPNASSTFRFELLVMAPFILKEPVSKSLTLSHAERK